MPASRTLMLRKNEFEYGGALYRNDLAVLSATHSCPLTPAPDTGPTAAHAPPGPTRPNVLSRFPPTISYVSTSATVGTDTSGSATYADSGLPTVVPTAEASGAYVEKM